MITHNRGTVEIADTLYGVTMGGDGVSQVLSLRLGDLPLDEDVDVRDLAGRRRRRPGPVADCYSEAATPLHLAASAPSWPSC